MMRERKEIFYQAEVPGIPLCIVTPEGLIQHCNRHLAGRIGTSRKTIIGRSCREVFNCTKEDATQCPLVKIKASQQVNPVSIRRKTFTTYETAEPVYNDSGNVTAVLLSFPSNLSVPAAIGRDLVKLQKLETISQAAGGIVHDLNNILMCMDAEIKMLRDKLQDPDSNQCTDKEFSSMLSILSRGQGLTHHLLKLSKGQKPETGPTAIGETIKEAVNFSLLGTIADSATTISSELWPVQTNSEQIFQLVSNLTINARHAADPARKLKIIIAADNVSKEEASQSGLRPGNYVKISIEDNGHGIPAEHMDRIFEPFFTTKPDGTGLGLALVNLIVKEMTGQIKVGSTLGKGSKFTVYLPALNLNCIT